MKMNKKQKNETIKGAKIGKDIEELNLDEKDKPINNKRLVDNILSFHQNYEIENSEKEEK